MTKTTGIARTTDLAGPDGHVVRMPRVARTRRGARGASLVLAGAAVALGALAGSAQAQVGYSTKPFATWSPFNTTLGTSPPVGAGGSMVGAANRGVSYQNYTPIVYRGRSTDPTYTIRLRNVSIWGPNPLHTLRVQIPSGALGGHDSDGHMTIVLPERNLVVSLYQADLRPSGTTWYASWGGMAPLNGSGTNREDSNGGREAGISQLAGLITPDDVRRGIAMGENGDLGHAVSVGFPTVHKTRFVYPAIRAKGHSTSSSALLMGQKIYLDPKLDPNSINFKIPYVSSSQSERFSRLLVRTLQRYGAVVVTNAPNLQFQLLNPKSYTALGVTNPWPALIGKDASGSYGYTVRPIPASAWRVLPPGS